MASLAAAQTPGPDPADRAEQSFREGRDFLSAGDNQNACVKFRESLALFRRASTLLNLGVCSEAIGQLAESLAFWEEGAALLEASDKRLELAKQKVATLQAQVPKLTVTLPEKLPANAVIVLDDVAVAREALVPGMRLNPGAHTIAIEAPGYERSVLSIELLAGEDKTQALELGAPMTPLQPDPTPPSPEPPRPSWSPPPDTTSEHHIPVWVWPVGGVGIALAIAAIPFGVDYASTLSRQEELCGGELERCAPDPPGSYDPADDNDRKFRDAVLVISFAAGGGALTALAVIAGIIGDSNDDTTVGASLGGAGVIVRF